MINTLPLYECFKNVFVSRLESRLKRQKATSYSYYFPSIAPSVIIIITKTTIMYVIVITISKAKKLGDIIIIIMIRTNVHPT